MASAPEPAATANRSQTSWNWNQSFDTLHAALLEEAEEDLLAFYPFPADHWTKLRSTNPLERFNREIGRRTDVVGIFPNDRSLIRLAASVLIAQKAQTLKVVPKKGDLSRRLMGDHANSWVWR